MPFTVTMPKLSPTMEIGTVAKWYKKEGEQVEPGELLLEVATDKATIEHEALDGGWLRRILVQDGGEAAVNQPIAIFTEEKEESIEGYTPEGIDVIPPQEPVEAELKEPKLRLDQPKFAPEFPLEPATQEKRIKASPLAKKLAKVQGLDLSSIKGTGPGGRIMSYDLEGAPRMTGKGTYPPGAYEEEKLTHVRKIISQRLQESKTFIPHFYVSIDINAQPLYEIREQLRSKEIKFSVTDFIVRASALALKDHPNINSGFNSVNQSIIRYKTIDVCVAVSAEEGLITPIVRNADYKNIGEISVELRSLAKKTREGKLEIHEFKGGSFTVSNLGMYNVTDFQAIINPPQAAILAVSGIHDTPVVQDGKVAPGKVMKVSLSSDHRVIDGVAAAKFANSLKEYLENPAVLLE